MEVKHTKQLHRHSLPIIVLAAGVLVVSLLTFSYYTATETGHLSLKKALTTRLISVKPAKNGLAKVSIYHVNAPKQDTTTTSQTLSGSSQNDLGETAQFNLTMQSATAATNPE